MAKILTQEKISKKEKKNLQYIVKKRCVVMRSPICRPVFDNKVGRDCGACE